MCDAVVVVSVNGTRLRYGAGRGPCDNSDDPAGRDLGPVVPGRAEPHRAALLFEKVIVSPNDPELRLRANGVEELALELRPNVPDELGPWLVHSDEASTSNEVLRIAGYLPFSMTQDTSYSIKRYHRLR